MKESAVSEKKAGSVSAQRAKKAASLTRDVLKVADQPLMSIVQTAGCRDCGPSVQSLAVGIMQTPVAQRQAAAMSLQRARGNRFVQRMAVQARLDGRGQEQAGGIAAEVAFPVVQRYVKVGLYEGSLGLDHIGVGVNSEKTKGFSPKPGLGREAEKGSWVDGEVKEDHDQIDSLTIRTSPQQEARLHAALNRSESSSQKFNLYQHNCAQHGAEILKSAGLSVKNSPLPRAFFEGLKRQYASGPGETAADGEPVQGKFESKLPAAEPAQAALRPNRTGMSDHLKAGIESLSGIDMSDVRVHPNSERPARLNALAYTQGSQIYLGPGQERHLSHEAWHVVQQKQGRVRATGKMGVGGVPINDDAKLEMEAEGIGRRAECIDNIFMQLQPLQKKTWSNMITQQANQENLQLNSTYKPRTPAMQSPQSHKIAYVGQQYMQGQRAIQRMDDERYKSSSSSYSNRTSITAESLKKKLQFIHDEPNTSKCKKITIEEIKNAIAIGMSSQEEKKAQKADYINKVIADYLEVSEKTLIPDRLDDAITNTISAFEDEEIAYYEVIDDVLDTLINFLSSKTTEDKITERDLEGFDEAEDQSELAKTYDSFSSKGKFRYEKNKKINNVRDHIKERLRGFLNEMLNKAGDDFDEKHPNYHAFLKILIDGVKKIKQYLLENASSNEIEILGTNGIIAGLMNIQTTNAVGFDCHAKMMTNMIVRLS